MIFMAVPEPFWRVEHELTLAQFAGVCQYRIVAFLPHTCLHGLHIVADLTGWVLVP